MPVSRTLATEDATTASPMTTGFSSKTLFENSTKTETTTSKQPQSVGATSEEVKKDEQKTSQDVVVVPRDAFFSDPYFEQWWQDAHKRMAEMEASFRQRLPDLQNRVVQDHDPKSLDSNDFWKDFIHQVNDINPDMVKDEMTQKDETRGQEMTQKDHNVCETQDLPKIRALGSFPFLRRFLSTPDNAIDEVKHEDGQFKVMLDVQGYTPEEVKVKVVDNVLTVEGKHEQKSDESSSSRTFLKKYTLPSGTEPETVTCSLSKDGVITVQTPAKMSEQPERKETIVSIKKE